MSHSIFLLDDDESLVEVLEMAFKTIAGWNCLKAHSFEEMQNSELKILACDLALIDINLGEGKPSGLDAFRWLKNNHWSKPIVFFTGHAHSHPDVQTAQRLGEADVLEKPIDIDRLIGLLKKRLSNENH